MINRITKYQRPSNGVSSRSNASTDEAADSTFLKKTGQQVLGRIEQTVTDHPMLALGVALAAGISLGWLAKRR